MTTVSKEIRYVGPDGRLTLDGLALFQDMIAQAQAATDRLAAIAAVASPVGGGTVDTEARTAIDAIRSAAS